MYACMYVCMNICMYACMYVCMYSIAFLNCCGIQIFKYSIYTHNYVHICTYTHNNSIFYAIFTGYAGSDGKVAYIKELGFDEAINYKKIESLSDSLKQACPKSIDMFFNNVSNYNKTNIDQD